MKKNFIIILSAILLTFTGCNMSNGANKSFDNSDLTPVVGEEGYYTDESLVFCAEIRGSYKANRAFTLDAENENLRVWDNMYLYEGDYFQMIVNESPTIFYSVNSEDLEYVTIEDKFAWAKINEGQSGIYKITFDLTTKLFDLEFKSEITEPVYEKMNGCDVYSLASEFTAMTVNPRNSEEWMIENYPIEAGALVSFHNHGNVHLSNYKVILDASVQGKYASAIEDGDKHVSFIVGGLYNLYVNLVTYEVRVELTNPDTADYVLQVYENGELVDVNVADPNVPYLFNYTLTVTKLKGMPIFVGGGYVMYDLDVNESEYVDSDGYFKVTGTYLLEINLKTFTITANYLSE
ncbi:MAG: hypothetical protein IKA20_06680 [Clostridia bacterium]|nr:hypothetical protein [Clostridia bacterium]